MPENARGQEKHAAYQSQCCTDANAEQAERQGDQPDDRGDKRTSSASGQLNANRMHQATNRMSGFMTLSRWMGGFGLLRYGRPQRLGRFALQRSASRNAARARIRVEPKVGSGESASLIRSGNSVHPSATVSHPRRWPSAITSHDVQLNPRYLLAKVDSVMDGVVRANEQIRAGPLKLRNGAEQQFAHCAPSPASM